MERHSDWYNFTSVEGAFSVLMPRTRTRVLQLRLLVSHTELMYGAKVGPVAYVVRYAHYPPDVIKNAGTDNWLDSERDYLVISVPGKLLSERTISIDGYPGRELRVQADDGKFRIARLYLRFWTTPSPYGKITANTPEPTTGRGYSLPCHRK